MTEKIMFSRNLSYLRDANNYSQEELAETIGVTRQSIAKWENGESLPDVINCAALAELFDVTLDHLLHYNQDEKFLPIPPKGKHIFGSVTVNEDGTVKLSEESLKTLNINRGDRLVLLGDENPESIGLALVPVAFFTSISSLIMEQEANDE